MILAGHGLAISIFEMKSRLAYRDKKGSTRDFDVSISSLPAFYTKFAPHVFLGISPCVLWGLPIL